MPHRVAGGRSHPPQLVRFAVRRGAPLAAAPGGVVWARMARTQIVAALPIDRADGRVQIASLPGLPPKPCAEHEHIWVHVRDIVWRTQGR